MTASFLIVANLVMPLISGLFLLFYFVYFIFAHPSRALSYRLFVIFLIGFSLFLFGRPLQLLLGDHPLPLIVVNIRVFILCSVLAPLSILMARTYNKPVTRRVSWLVVLSCLPLGLTYAVFNTLGTQASYRLFEVAGFVAYENLTPSMQAPYYGREVTIGVQTITGVILCLFSLLRLIRHWQEQPKTSFFADKEVLINVGVFLFALSFILGSLAMQWWVYYVMSVATALFVGGSVLIDIKEIHNYYEKLVPFIKEEIINSMTFSELSKPKLIEMLSCLGKKTDLNTFILVKIINSSTDLRGDAVIMGTIVQMISRRLEPVLSEDSFLILPISGLEVGIVLHLPFGKPEGYQSDIFDRLDEVREEITKNCHRELAIGIGRSCQRLEELRRSYHEARNALDYAEQLEGGGLVHVNNISQPIRRERSYPVQEKDRLLALIRVGDIINIRSAVEEFFLKFQRYIEEEPAALKIRLYELACSFIDSAILGGGDETTLNGLGSQFLDEIERISDPVLAESWLDRIAAECTSIVVQLYESRSKLLIDSAKNFIEANYQTQLSYRDVAREISISPSYFLSLFKKETGATFVDYLTTLRIDKAKQLLRKTELSIGQIAYQTGFNNANYFSNLFRKIVGVSAKEFRRPTIE